MGCERGARLHRGVLHVRSLLVITWERENYFEIIEITELIGAIHPKLGTDGCFHPSLDNAYLTFTRPLLRAWLLKHIWSEKNFSLQLLETSALLFAFSTGNVPFCATLVAPCTRPPQGTGSPASPTAVDDLGAAESQTAAPRWCPLPIQKPLFPPHLQKFLANHIMETRVFWLGLSDMHKEGDWQWLDGRSLSLA